MKTTNLKANELEKKFEAGDDDLLDHFESVKDDGLPEPDFTKRKVSAELTVDMIKKIDRLSKESGNTRSAVIRNLLTVALAKLAKD